MNNKKPNAWANLEHLEALLQLSIEPHEYDEIVENLFQGGQYEPENIEKYADYAFDYGRSQGYLEAVVNIARSKGETRVLLSEVTSNHVLYLANIKGLMRNAKGF